MLEIYDTHTHVVSGDVGRYPLVATTDDSQSWHRDRPVDAEELLALADAAGVHQVAFVQAISCYGDDNRYALASARRHHARTVAVGTVSTDHPDAVASLRRDVLEFAMRGVRIFSPDPSAAPFAAPPMRRVVPAAADLAIPVVVLALPHQLASVRMLVTAFPSVSFVLDHCGFADFTGAPPFADADDLFALARATNVVCKVSSINLQATAEPRALWRTLVDRFGSHRLMWGSDHPHTPAPDYATLVDLARTTTDALGRGERTDVLAATAQRIWPSAS